MFRGDGRPIVQKILSLDQLDQTLDQAAEKPERFEAIAEELITRCDAEGHDLEIRDEASWRRGDKGPARTSFVQQFRADVDGILPMDREEEARLARRIEFARLRLAKARLDAGLDDEEGELVPSTQLPRTVSRRSLELHALRTEMVERNLYLVLINVERYAQSGASRLDLIQEGCVSLFRAVDGFDWRRGLLFRTYAVHWLNQAFRNYLYNNSHTVRVPVYLQKALKHINQATIRIGDANATPEEIAQNSDLNENLVTSAIAAARGSYSIDADHGSDDEDSSRLRDLLVDPGDGDPYDPTIEEVSLEDGLERGLENLSEREQLVVRMRFGIGYPKEHTLAEVAAELGVSVERVRQIQVRALVKLDTPVLRRDLEPFVN